MSSTPIIFLACKIFEGIIGQQENISFEFLDYGLHSVPKQLKVAVQDYINAVEQPSTIILGYGLCGNGLNQIKSGPHTLIIPKADDCVAMFMGSRARYMEQFTANPGTYYLTKGWFEVGSTPLNEYKKLLEKYDQATADWLMETQYQHYKRLVFVAHNQADLDAYRPAALEVAQFCERFNMAYEEYLGSSTFIDQIAEVITTQSPIDDSFIVIPPGQTLTQMNFI